MRRPRRRFGSSALLALLITVAVGALLLAFLPLQRAASAPAAPDEPPPMVAGPLEAARIAFLPGAFLDARTQGFTLVFEPVETRAGDAREGTQALLVLEQEGRSAEYTIDLPAATRRVEVPCPGLAGFLPASLRLSWIGPPADRRRLTGVQALRVDPEEPIPADLGAILLFQPSFWRHPDYEIFRWSASPSILVFDTASYDVQDRLFKRLAFFVEKKGFAGTIPEMDQIATLHGFNAHDYRAEDLARFYLAAAREGVALLPEETALRDALLRSGVLERSGSSLRAGSGGVLSISRSTAPATRVRFLTHEALHGLYFSSVAFRSGASAVWERSSDELRQFIRLYLSWPDWSYDLDNPYLMVNEFMAYLLQYSEAEVERELFERGLDWLAERFPERRGWLEAFAKRGPAELLGAHRGLDELLWREIGRRRAGLVSLRRAR